MSPVRLLTRDEVAAKLEEAGCDFVAHLDERNDFWVSPWGFMFTVPALGDDGMCPKTKLFEILAELERLRPAGH